MRNVADVILKDGRVQAIDNSLEYGRALMDSANWGEAMSEAMNERAELNRNCIERRCRLDAKIQQKKRTLEVIEKLKVNFVGEKEAALAAMHEQTYDVRIDLNEALLQFCQAYFYENHRECSENTKPEFGKDMVDLLLKILSARNDDLLVGVCMMVYFNYQKYMHV